MRTTLQLYKENFKFSSAHFLIFDSQRAERLHGHNYQVFVDLTFAQGPNDLGLLTDFNVFKKYIKAKLDEWDERVLLPHLQSEMKFESAQYNSLKILKMTFRDRFYTFPENEVVLLPITNTSVEQLSKLLAQDFVLRFQSQGVSSIKVRVEETLGQSAETYVEA